jgi:spore coat protein H
MNPPPFLPSPPPPLASGRPQPRKRSWIRILAWTGLAGFVWIAGVVTLGVLSFLNVSNDGPQQWFPPGQVPFEPGNPRWGRHSSTPVRPPSGEVPTNLWRLAIEIAPTDADKLRQYSWGGPGNTVERPEVFVTVREGSATYTNVALHLKGAAGSFRPFDDKPALTLHFSKKASGQKFHGYTKLSLNNSVQDPSFVSEALAREIFVEAGVPAPRADHATVLINGRDLGLYVLTEGWGKPFLRRFFPKVDGNLYDGGFVQDLDSDLEITSGDDGEGRQELRALMEAARDPDSAERWKRLSALLDVDRFATLLAVEVMLCHWDGYGLNRNNYRVFHDRAAERLVFMPHGLDQLFGVDGRMATTSQIEPPMQGQVARGFVATPAGHRLYLQRIAQLRTNVFLEEKLTSRVRELSQRIRPTLAAYDPGLATEHDEHIEDLCQRICQRVQSIAEQLDRPREPMIFPPDGTLRLTRWRARPAPQRPEPPPQFEQAEVDGTKVLRIQTSPAGGAGSWRVRVPLGPGHYRFEGRVRGEGSQEKSLACLRISGTKVRYLPVPDGEWTPLAFDFHIEDELADIELICEFQSQSGTAAFDEASLRLVRE